MFRYLLCTAMFLLASHTVADDFPAHDYSPEVVFNDPELPAEGAPRVIIDAPDSVLIGDMIIIDLSDSIGGGFDLRIIPEPPRVRVFNDGQIITTATGPAPTEYLFIFSCAVGDKSDIQTKVIQVVSPEPEPEPEPEPPAPNTLLGKIMGWCGEVKSPTAQADAARLQQSFGTLATVIASGAFEDVAQVMEATRAATTDALGDNVEYWNPFLASLTTELGELFDAGKLPTIESHSDVWATVAKGLQQFANRGEVQ